MAQDAITNKSIINADYKLNKGFAKLAAIPTTAGSGAEVTANAVIYINSKKYSVEGSSIKPDYFFLIPQLLLNSSKKLKASSGFDAISQAIESIISTRSNKISLKHAKLSLNLSSKNYLNFVKKKKFICLKQNEFSGLLLWGSDFNFKDYCTTRNFLSIYFLLWY